MKTRRATASPPAQTPRGRSSDGCAPDFDTQAHPDVGAVTLANRFPLVGASERRPTTPAPPHSPQFPHLPRPHLRYPPSRGMFVAERSCREICDSSPVRTHAQSRAEIESSHPRVPYITGCEFSPSTVLRAPALQLERSRYLLAYAPRKIGPHCRAQRQPSRNPQLLAHRRIEGKHGQLRHRICR